MRHKPNAKNRRSVCEGCTPGYWKQRHHFDSWVDFDPDDLFVDVFGSDIFGDITLAEALRLRGGKENALGRHAVAALLNAASEDVDYGLTPADVIDLFHYALDNDVVEETKNMLDELNNAGCPLN